MLLCQLHALSLHCCLDVSVENIGNKEERFKVPITQSKLCQRRPLCCGPGTPGQASEHLGDNGCNQSAGPSHGMAPVHLHHTRHQHLHWHTGSGMGNTGQQWAVYSPAMQCQLSSLSVRIVTSGSVQQAVIHSVVRQTWSTSLQLELINTQFMI